MEMNFKSMLILFIYLFFFKLPDLQIRLFFNNLIKKNLS